MDVARLNFSHGSYENHKMLIQNLRFVSKELGKPVAIIQDLQGPRVRLGELPKEGIFVKKGQQVIFTYRKKYTGQDIPFDYPLHKDLKPGHRLLIQDGLIQLEVVQVRGKEVKAKVLAPGKLMTHKGVNIPDTSIHAPVVTVKDKKDLRFGLKQDVDFIALSFVEKASDVRLLKKLIKQYARNYQPKIIVKIERSKAVDNFDEILGETDAVMIARGDLGVDLPPQDVPLIQKDLIKKCLVAGKPVIVATQMLESMIENPRPTRAEASDVANAVIDHTDAVMLSGESAYGKYPVEAVTVMKDIAVKTEASKYNDLPLDFFGEYPKTFLDALTTSLAKYSKQKLLKAIVVLSASESKLARVVARHRVEVPIFAVTSNKNIYRELVLSWGIFPVYLSKLGKNSKRILGQLKRKKYFAKGNIVVVIKRKKDRLPSIASHLC